MPPAPCLIQPFHQTLLPDGVRTIVTGGVRSMGTGTPVPSAEIYNHTSRGIVKLDALEVMRRWAGYTLYPLMIVLPYEPLPGVVQLVGGGGGVRPVFAERRGHAYVVWSHTPVQERAGCGAHPWAPCPPHHHLKKARIHTRMSKECAPPPPIPVYIQLR